MNVGMKGEYNTMMNVRRKVTLKVGCQRFSDIYNRYIQICK